MKYVKATLKYIFGHFPRIMLISVVPALFFAFFLHPDAFGIIVRAEDIKNVTGFIDELYLCFNPAVTFKRPYLILIGFALLLVSVSYTMGMIEKHFKVGRLSLRSPLSNVNNCVLPVALMLLIILLAYFVYRLLLFCVLTLLLKILGMAAGNWVSAFVWVIGFVGMLALVLILKPVLFTATTMLVYGYSFKDAMGVSLKLCEGVGRVETDFALALPFVSEMLMGTLLAVFKTPFVVSAIINTVVITLMLQYVVAFSLIAMYDLAGLERRDLKKFDYRHGTRR